MCRSFSYEFQLLLCIMVCHSCAVELQQLFFFCLYLCLSILEIFVFLRSTCDRLPPLLHVLLEILGCRIHLEGANHFDLRSAALIDAVMIVVLTSSKT